MFWVRLPSYPNLSLAAGKYHTQGWSLEQGQAMAVIPSSQLQQPPNGHISSETPHA